MELINNFGLDPILLTAQIVNFLVVLFILRKFLYKPILTTLEKRKNLIKEGLKNAEDATINLERIQEKEKRVLRVAQEQARKIIAEAKKESLKIMQNTEEQTKVKAEKMIQQTRMQISLETKKVEKKLTLHVSRLAIDFLKKAIEDLFSKEDQILVMKNVLKKMEVNLIKKKSKLQA